MKRATLLLVIVLLLALTAAIAAGVPRYRKYQQRRGMEQARRFLKVGDFANASLSARRVLQIDPRNVGAGRFMAELAEHVRSPSAIDWRRRVAEVEPSLENRLALVACALQLEHPPYPIAREALRGGEVGAERVARFHVLAAELAIKSNEPGRALERFRQALRLDPTNILYQFNLSVLELQSTNALVAQAAREKLQQLSSRDELDVLALRSLIADGLLRNDLVSAERLSKRLLGLSGARFEDQLQFLTILQRQAGATNAQVEIATGLTESLASLQACASSNSVQLYSLCEWMGSHGLAKDALQWLAGLEPELRKAQPVPLAEANLYLRQKDWARLQEFLSGQAWGEMEFLRLALLARAEWGENHTALGDARWHSAVRAGSDRLGALMLLLGFADQWVATPEEVLWQINRRFPREQWVLGELERRYLAKGDTGGLNRVYAREIEERASSNVTNRNDFIFTSLLLGKNLAQAHTMAAQLYREHPEDVIIASTRAYSLHLQGRSAEGAAILGRFPEQELQQPAIALYYGILLTATGQREQANQYLARVQQIRLSPEEKKLLDAAKAKCGVN